MLDQLRDIVFHVNGMNINIVKITGEDGSVTVEGIDEDKTVIVKGRLKKDIKDLDGVFGLTNLDQLDRIIKFYDQKTDIVNVSRTKKEFNVEVRNDEGEVVTDTGGEIVTEKRVEDAIDQIVFFRANPKVQNNYRVVNRRMIPEQYNMAKAPSWNLVFDPSKKAIDMFAAQAAIGVDEYFGFVTADDEETKKTNLYIQMGPAGNEALLEFHPNVSSEFNKNWVWKVDLVLKILKMADSARTTISLLDKGAMKITLDTGLAEYDYMLPAKSR